MSEQTKETHETSKTETHTEQPPPKQVTTTETRREEAADGQGQDPAKE